MMGETAAAAPWAYVIAASVVIAGIGPACMLVLLYLERRTR